VCVGVRQRARQYVVVHAVSVCVCLCLAIFVFRYNLNLSYVRFECRYLLFFIKLFFYCLFFNYAVLFLTSS
jgi:hypothetical protein